MLAIWAAKKYKFLIKRIHNDKVKLFRFAFKCGMNVDILNEHSEEQKNRLAGGSTSIFKIDSNESFGYDIVK